MAKAIERDLNISCNEFHVSKHHPEHFMIRFAHVRHRDIAFDVGVVTYRGVALSLTTWSPLVHGHSRIWRYYCRIIVENMSV